MGKSKKQLIDTFKKEVGIVIKVFEEVATNEEIASVIRYIREYSKTYKTTTKQTIGGKKDVRKKSNKN